MIYEDMKIAIFVFFHVSFNINISWDVASEDVSSRHLRNFSTILKGSAVRNSNHLLKECGIWHCQKCESYVVICMVTEIRSKNWTSKIVLIK